MQIIRNTRDLIRHRIAGVRNRGSDVYDWRLAECIIKCVAREIYVSRVLDVRRHLYDQCHERCGEWQRVARCDAGVTVMIVAVVATITKYWLRVRRSDLAITVKIEWL